MAGDHGIYMYAPSEIGAIIAAALFGLSAILHLVKMIIERAWYYTPLVVGAIMMAVGYAARYVSAQSPSEMIPYIAQSLFIILPPSLYAATIYMIYGRLVLFVGAPEASVIRPTRVTKIFVLGDMLAFFMQMGGGGMMASAERADMGQKIMLAGLFVQLLFFGFFIVISVIFYIRMRHSPARYNVGKRSWTSLLKMIFCAAIIIILRCIFRVIEFAQGHSGYLISHEIYLYVFDTAPMFAVQVMFHFMRAQKVFQDGSMEKLDDTESFIELRGAYLGRT